MRPSVALARHRDAICALVATHRAANPRVFGSVAFGEDTEASDLDLLVDTVPGTSLWDIVDLHRELEKLLGIKVDVVTTGGLSKYMRERVMATATAL